MHDAEASVHSRDAFRSPRSSSEEDLASYAACRVCGPAFPGGPPPRPSSPGEAPCEMPQRHSRSDPLPLARRAWARSRRASKMPQHAPREHLVFWGGRDRGRPAVARKLREPACPDEPHRGPRAPGQVHSCASGHGAQPGREGLALFPPRAVRRRTRRQDRGAPPQ